MRKLLEDEIRKHYENKDYTEVVRDAILCMNSEIRKKSDLPDVDGVDLINKAFSESKPLIKISKLESISDKNIQRGIANLSKGIIEYFRNPMSHTKREYSKQLADALLVIIDKVILENIDNSKNINSIEEWYAEIVSEASPNSIQYAQILADKIPERKRYETLVMIYKNRNNIKTLKDKIIDEILKRLSEEEFKDFISVIEEDLYGDRNKNDIVSALKFISNRIWNGLSELSKAKIEGMTLEDISKISVEYEEISYNNCMPAGITNSNILENTKHLITDFSNSQEIIDNIIQKILDSTDEFLISYLFENYLTLITKNKSEKNCELIKYINNNINQSDLFNWSEVVKNIIKKLDKENDFFIGCKEIFNISIDDNKASNDDLPF